MITFSGGADDRWRFYVRDAKNSLIASSEGYATKADAQRGYADLWSVIVQNAPSSMQVENDEPIGEDDKD